MANLERSDLWSLEQYSEKRNDFRAEVMAHKRDRNLSLGNNLRLYFEDEKTIRYQIQEMLRIEKVFDADGIQEELDAYNPLIPDGMNWKATFMIEYTEIEERKEMLAKLIGIEDRVWMQVEGFDRIWPIADEDLERSTEQKTSSVHFMRWQLEPSMVVALKKGANLYAGVEHKDYQIDPVLCNQAVTKSLIQDLNDIGLN